MPEILLVDDDRSIRNSMRAMLEAEGFAVRTARGADEAVQAFRERRPDVVLLDVMMPGKGGIQACAELRAIDRLAPIIFLTAVPSDTTKLRAFGAGADDYIETTCNPDVLVARIRAA
ncbi:MAG: response regulator, partial [Kiritimatiellae bacterium]|nr:response regulator [Kiritimatiellia bacterium]